MGGAAAAAARRFQWGGGEEKKGHGDKSKRGGHKARHDSYVPHAYI